MLLCDGLVDDFRGRPDTGSGLKHRRREYVCLCHNFRIRRSCCLSLSLINGGSGSLRLSVRQSYRGIRRLRLSLCDSAGVAICATIGSAITVTATVVNYNCLVATQEADLHKPSEAFM